MLQHQIRRAPNAAANPVSLMINKLLALSFAIVLAGCAAPTSVAGDPRFQGASTVQLQERRLELYQKVPRFSKRYGATQQYTTTYVTHGGPLPAQDEIVLIERELNWRAAHGDRAAYFQPAAPQLPPYSQQSGG
jgi:hypothetical protein